MFVELFGTLDGLMVVVGRSFDGLGRAYSDRAGECEPLTIELNWLVQTCHHVAASVKQTIPKLLIRRDLVLCSIPAQT